MTNTILIRYNEIGLKGRNRYKFENKLIDNIRISLKLNKINDFKIKKMYSRIKIIFLRPLNQKNKDKITNIISHIFGISSFSIGYELDFNYEKITEFSLKLIKNNIHNFQTFKVETKRSDKNFPLTSIELNKKLGELIINETNKQVDIHKPDLILFIELADNKAFVFINKIKGLNGLPIGSSGTALSLISGGIDSPVASFYALKRGLKLDYIHFSSAPFIQQASIDKIKQIIKDLKIYNPKSKLYLCQFGYVQKQIMLNCPEKLRIILYRRFMFRIAEEIAKKNNIKTLVTGENLGQVASQTIDNMLNVQQVTKLFLFRPLIGFDKQEIINKAKEIKTYQTSILPHEDCCTMFTPQNPETHSQLDEIIVAEKSISVSELINLGLKNLEIIDF